MGFRMSEGERTQGTPLYLALVDEIRGEIARGDHRPGQRLPSIRELAEAHGLSVSTARYAYDLLERQGLIQRRKGRGTYVAGPPEPLRPESRKEKALEAIDGAIRTLAGLGFSAREMEIFFDLRLRQQVEATRPVRIALVAATPEERSIMARALSDLGGVQCDRIPFSELADRPDRLMAGFDLIVCPEELRADLEACVGSGRDLSPVAITVSQQTLLSCGRIPREARVGILTVSSGFAKILEQTCRGVWVTDHPPVYELFGQVDRTGRLIEACDVILVSPDYSSLVGSEERALLRGESAMGRQVIRAAFDLDRGSRLYLEEAVRRIDRALRESLPREGADLPGEEETLWKL